MPYFINVGHSRQLGEAFVCVDPLPVDLVA